MGVGEEGGVVGGGFFGLVVVVPEEGGDFWGGHGGFGLDWEEGGGFVRYEMGTKVQSLMALIRGQEFVLAFLC